MRAAAAGVQIRTGLTRLVESPSLLGPGPTGLCTNYTAITDELRRGVDAVVAAGVDVTVLFTPEHGYWGAVQAGESGGPGRDERTELPVVDTYLADGERLDALLAASGVWQVVIDLQDVGVRFYTYIWTLFDLLCSAARLGLRIVVLDRPNPLGGRLRTGPGLDPALSSFVGRVSIPLQHGMTLGELALWFNAVHVPEATGSTAALDVIAMIGWERQRLDETSVHWVMPSPNIPTLTTATAYPATGLIEGTVLSEGRGTTRPFQLVGAPWTDERLTAALTERNLPGVAFREAVFRPTFSKWAGANVHGTQLHITDPGVFDPVATGVALLQTVAALYPAEALWRPAEPGRPPFIDLLWGSSVLREGIDRGADLDSILTAGPATPLPPGGVLLYP